MNIYQIITKPLQSEKILALQNARVYCFQVHPKANKIQIKHAIAELYNVKVIECNTVVRHGKPKRVRNIPGRTSLIKKAYIQLAENQTLPFVEGES